eukprot:1160594-Pelagomonas_calceolata.AAC.2
METSNFRHPLLCNLTMPRDHYLQLPSNITRVHTGKDQSIEYLHWPGAFHLQISTHCQSAQRQGAKHRTFALARCLLFADQRTLSECAEARGKAPNTCAGQVPPIWRSAHTARVCRGKEQSTECLRWPGAFHLQTNAHCQGAQRQGPKHQTFALARRLWRTSNIAHRHGAQYT